MTKQTGFLGIFLLQKTIAAFVVNYQQ